MDGIILAIYILNAVIILITFYLIFLYIKSEQFKVYPCYNILIISIIICFDNVFRIIPLKGIKAVVSFKFFKVTQAFLLTLMDKLLLTTISSQMILLYLGVCHCSLYFKSERFIFNTNLIIGIILSVIISIIYMKNGEGIANYNNYFYCGDSSVKRYFDTSFNGVFLLGNLVLAILLLTFISTKKKEVSLGLIENLDYGHHFIKILIMLIINSLLFIESYLIIYDKLDFMLPGLDLLYLSTCLIILLFYSINKIIIKETLRILCPAYYKKLYPSVKRNSSLLDDFIELEPKETPF